MAFRLFVESSQAGAGAAGRGRRASMPTRRIFHHHPWQDASLQLTAAAAEAAGRRRRQGGTADDGDESSEADAGARHRLQRLCNGSVSERPRCVVLMDARGCVEEALKSDVGSGPSASF